MKRPSLSEFAQLAEVIAAVAVVVSLLYVGRELRDNTAAIRAESLQGVADASGQLLANLAADADLARIRLIGDRDPTRLSSVDAYRYGVSVRYSMFVLQNVYFQHELDVLDPRVWAGYRGVLCELWSNPGIRATWDVHRRVLDPGFAELIEQCPEG